MKKHWKEIASYCRFFTWGFVTAATAFTWILLLIENHWLFASIIALVVFASIVPEGDSRGEA